MSELYVPDKVFLVCSDGMKKNQVMVKSQQTVKIADKRLAATINDRFEGNFFCAKMVIAGAIIGAIAAAIFCAAVVLSGGTIGLAAAAAIGAGAAAGGAGLGALTALMPSICSMLTSGGKWVPIHPKVKFQKQEALIDTSKIPCYLGGNVMILYSEKAADEFTDLKMWQTLTNVGGIVLGSALLSQAVVVVCGAGSVFAANTKMVYSVFGAKAAFVYGGQTLATIGLGIGASKVVDAVKGGIYDLIGVGDYAEGKPLQESYKLTTSNEPMVDVGKTAGNADAVSDGSSIVRDQDGNHNTDPKVSQYEEMEYTRRTGMHTNDGTIIEEAENERVSNKNPNLITEKNPNIQNAPSTTHIGDRSGSYYEQDNLRMEQGRQLDLSMSKKEALAKGKEIRKNAWPSPLEWAIDAYNIASNYLLQTPINDYKNALANEEAAARNAITVIENNI
jgi:hypothetical protein